MPLYLYELSNWSDSEYLTATSALDAINTYERMFGDEAARMITDVCKVPHGKEMTFDGVTRTAEEWVKCDPNLFMSTVGD